MGMVDEEDEMFVNFIVFFVTDIVNFTSNLGIIGVHVIIFLINKGKGEKWFYQKNVHER